MYKRKLILFALFCIICFSASFSQDVSSDSSKNVTSVSAKAKFTKVKGIIQQSNQWGSGYIDISPFIDLKKGSTIRVIIGGPAKKVLIRILLKGQSPDQPEGVLGAFDVPANKTIDVILNDDFENVRQISVHGSPKAWDWDLGEDNGNARLVNVFLK